MREIASKAITNGLKGDGNFKVVFVMILRTGRLRPIDIACIQTVLTSANDQIHSFGVIINQMEEEVYKQIKNHKEEKEKIVSQIKQNKNVKPRTLFLKRYNKLEGENNAVLEIPELKSFVDRVPAIKINPNKVSYIPNDDTIEKLTNEITSHECKLPKEEMNTETSGQDEEKPKNIANDKWTDQNVVNKTKSQNKRKKGKYSQKLCSFF